MLLKTKSLKFWLAASFMLVLLISASFTLNPAAAVQEQPKNSVVDKFNPDAYAAWRNSMLRDENGNIPDNALEIALAEKEKLAQAQSEKDGGGSARDFAGVYPGGWQELGPNNVGGRVRALVIHPTTPNTIWVGTAGGGIWKTTDGGASWFPTNMPIMPVSTIVLDPDNANTLYAGTGEGFFNVEAIRGAGIYKSTNGGIDWTQLGATTGSNFQYVNKLAIAKVSGQTTILAATRASLYRSTDNGTTWPVVGGTVPTSVMDVEFNPNDSLRVVASGDSGKAWYSTNGGANWTAATFNQSVSGNSVARVELAYAKSANGTVFASVNSYQNDAGGNQVYGEIYKSVNNGQSYDRINSGDGYLGQTAGRYANSIWVDPTDANRLVVGGIELWLSTNAISGGSSVRISQISRGVLNPANPGYYQHTIVAHPGYNGSSNRIVFIAGDGGIYKTNDILNTSPVAGWQNLNNGLAITQLFDAKIHPLSGVIYAGSQGNGLLRYTSNAFDWQRHSGAGENLDTVSIALDPTDPKLVYASGPQLAAYRSTDAGASADYINTGITEALSDTANRVAPLLLDPNNPKWLYGGAIGLWRTQNVTATVPFWQNIRSDSGGCNSVNCISTLTIDSSNSGILWVGFGNGRVYRTTNATTTPPTWTTIDDNSGTNPITSNRFVTSIYLSQAVTKSVYLSMGGYNSGNIWRGNTAGTSWTNIHNNLPNVPVYAIVEHPTIPNWLYAGTETGLYTSENGGASWNVAATDGPNNAPVYKLFWRGTSLYAVTFGRGIFKADIPGNVPNLLNVNVAFDDTRFGNSNGRIDANEAIDLQITLRNAGTINTTGITSSLVVTSGNAAIVEGTASYSNLAAYGGTGANLTNYTLAVNQGTACTAKIYLRQTVYYNTTLTKTFDIVLTVGSIQNNPTQTFTYTGAAVAIPDNAPGGVEIPLVVNKTGTIGDINVSVNITHEFVSDLSLALVAPGGQTVLLASKRGSSGQNFSGTIFDDEALTNVTTGSAPFSGSFQPEQLLSTLDDTPISGTWKLRVIDTTEGELGGVISYSLTIQEKIVACNNLPGITTFFPTATNAGASGLTLAVYGTNFVPTTIARWNGTDLPTTYVSPTLLLAQVDAPKLASPQVVPISVFTSGVGEATSTKDFTVNAVCDPLVVSSTADSNNCGTFRQALTYVATPSISNTQITLALSLPATITLSLTSPLPALESGSSIVGLCHPVYGPAVALDGSNLTNGLTVQNNSLLRGLKIFGFGGKQLILNGVGVRAQCLKVDET